IGCRTCLLKNMVKDTTGESFYQQTPDSRLYLSGQRACKTVVKINDMAGFIYQIFVKIPPRHPVYAAIQRFGSQKLVKGVCIRANDMNSFKYRKGHSFFDLAIGL